MKKPSMKKWLKEAKSYVNAKKCGMYLFHIGVVREDAKAKVRFADEKANSVIAMKISYDEAKVNEAIESTKEMEGIYFVKVWLAKGRRRVGKEIMYVLVGGDIRPHVIKALNFLVDKLKNECMEEEELFSRVK